MQLKSSLRAIYHQVIKLVWLVVRPIMRARLKGAKIRIAITCSRVDGGGAQIHGRISTLAFAREFGLSYVHTPIYHLNVDGTESDIQRWNEVLLLEKLAVSKASDFTLLRVSTLRSLVYSVFFRAGQLDGVCFEVSHCHGYTDRFLESITRLQPELRKIIGPTLNLDSAIQFDSVVHVRGQVDGDEKRSPRRTDVEVVRAKVESAVALSRTQKVAVFTVKHDPKLVSLESSAVRVDSTSDVFVVLTEMIRAKNLFMAKSSLSYVAGLLSEGNIHYEAFWHPKLKDWLLFRT